MNCETCDNYLAWEPDENDKPALQAVKAKAAGVWVKNWCLYGDESGYHYFCSPVCANAYRDAHKGA